MPSGQEIVDIVVGNPGPTSDINIWRSRSAEFSESQKFQGDKAYVGDPRIDTPEKKPRNQGMTEKIKQ
jgi:DDE superfamily endonuclease